MSLLLRFWGFFVLIWFFCLLILKFIFAKRAYSSSYFHLYIVATTFDQFFPPPCKSEALKTSIIFFILKTFRKWHLKMELLLHRQH